MEEGVSPAVFGLCRQELPELEKYLERASETVAYYEQLVLKPNESERWQLGLSTARHWLRILQDAPEDLEQLEQLHQKLESERLKQGSVWLDMWVQVRNWIYVVEQKAR